MHQDYITLKQQELRLFTWAKNKVYSLLHKYSPHTKNTVVTNLFGCIYLATEDLQLALNGKVANIETTEDYLLASIIEEETQEIKHAYQNYSLKRLRQWEIVKNDYHCQKVYKLFLKYLKIIQKLKNRFNTRHNLAYCNIHNIIN